MLNPTKVVSGVAQDVVVERVDRGMENSSQDVGINNTKLPPCAHGCLDRSRSAWTINLKKAAKGNRPIHHWIVADLRELTENSRLDKGRSM